MNTTTDVASSPASSELVSVLPHNFVLDGETLIVDALVVYKNGTGSPKAINVATPFLSGTNVGPGRVNPAKSLYDPSTGTYHFEIQAVAPTTEDLDYIFDFNITVDGVVQQVRVGGSLTASPEYSMKSVSVGFEGDKLVAGFEIISRDGKEILLAGAKPTTLVNLSNRSGNGPEVVQKGNLVFLKWNANLNNSAAQIFIASGPLNVGTSSVNYSFALETKPVTIESSEIVINQKELVLTFNLSDSAEGPFTFSNLGLKENGKVVKAVASVPVVIGKQVKVRLVRTVPTRNKIEYTVTGGIVLGGNSQRVIPFELDTVDFVKANLPAQPEILVENISHVFANGVEKAVFRFTLNNEERTPLINVDGLRLTAPADSSVRNTVDYDSSTGELTVLRSVTTLTGTLTTRGSILAYDYSDTVIEGEFHSTITLEADPYRPARAMGITFNPIVYNGGDTDVGVVIPVSMVNGEIPIKASIKEVLSSVNLNTDNLVNRFTYNEDGTIAFQIGGTRLDKMVGRVYAFSIIIDVETPTGISSIPVYAECNPEQRPGKIELVLDGTSDISFDRRVALNYAVVNVPASEVNDLYVTAHSIEGLHNVQVNYIASEQTVIISGKVPGDADIFQYSGTIVLLNRKTDDGPTIDIPTTTYSRPAQATALSSHFTDGIVELNWMCRDAIGLIPASIVVNKNSWGIRENLGGPVGAPRYNKTTGILTQGFRSLEGNVDSTYVVSARFQFPMPDANVYEIHSSFDHKKSDKATRMISLVQDSVMVDVETMTATVFYSMLLPNGLSHYDLRVSNAVWRNDVAVAIVDHTFSNDRLVVTVAISPAVIHEDFVADFRLDITGPNARGHADSIVTAGKPVHTLTVLGGAYHNEGFVRFYAKAPAVDIARLGHVVKSVSNDVTNYPPTIFFDMNTGLIVLQYPVKSNEFVGRTYAVEGLLDLGDVQEPYKAHLTLKAIRPQYNDFILTQGGSAVDYKQGVMRINFNIDAFGMAGIGIPQETSIKVVGKDGQFKTDEEVIYQLDPVTGKGCFIVNIHDRTSVKFPNAELKVTITSPNVGNDYHGVIVGFSGQENTCEIISARFVPNKGEIVFKAGVGYGYPTGTRPEMVNFLGNVQFAENIESGSTPFAVEYDKKTGILEFRVKGNARPMGDVLYTGVIPLGIVDNKGKSNQIPVNIYHVARDNNESRQLTEEVISVETHEGHSQFTIRLGYVDYLYPPTTPSITCSAPNVSIEYDKVKGLAQITIAGDIHCTYPSSVSGVAYITDELSNMTVNGNRENVMTRIPLVDSNCPEGIHQLSQQWTPEGIEFKLTARIGGKKPPYVELIETVKAMAFNIDDSVLDYDGQSGIISVHVPAKKPKFAVLSIRGKLKVNAGGVTKEVVIDSGEIYPEGMTHIVSCGYNKETGRVEASWIIYGTDGNHPEKVNLGTGTEWQNVVNLNTGYPTKERYNPTSGIYYAEFAPAQRVLGQRAYKASATLTTGKENIPVHFSVSI